MMYSNKGTVLGFQNIHLVVTQNQETSKKTTIVVLEEITRVCLQTETLQQLGYLKIMVMEQKRLNNI